MVSVEAGSLAAAGFAIEFERLPASRRGPTLVLLHEGLGCVAMWRDFPALLNAATGLSVFSYSRPGYGRSSMVRLPRPLDFHTHDALVILPQVLNAAGIDECVFVGHSDGASIALIFAGAACNSGLRGLVLMAPHVLTESKTVMNIAAVKRGYATGGLRDRLRRYHGDNVDCAFSGWCDTWLDSGFLSWDITACLHSIHVPVLTVRGNNDAYNTSIHVERIVAEVSGQVTRVDLANCGHAPHVEQTERVVAAVTEFVAALGD
jgi:pimeloyl-ACP methyl ester carboxylesterase